MLPLTYPFSNLVHYVPLRSLNRQPFQRANCEKFGSEQCGVTIIASSIIMICSSRECVAFSHALARAVVHDKVEP